MPNITTKPKPATRVAIHDPVLMLSGIANIGEGIKNNCTSRSYALFLDISSQIMLSLYVSMHIEQN